MPRTEARSPRFFRNSQTLSSRPRRELVENGRQESLKTSQSAAVLTSVLTTSGLIMWSDYETFNHAGLLKWDGRRGGQRQEASTVKVSPGLLSKKATEDCTLVTLSQPAPTPFCL
ncbi:hypothetical protein Q8A73_001725 [Channa argus]|nr:hypothetical protein Q8A73_001725 [Channa argus]